MRIFFARGESRTDLNDLFSAAATSNISNRSDKGDTPYNLRNCAYWGDFARPKIVWCEISDRSKFAYDSSCEFVPEATTFLMTGHDLPYLLCLLNSPLAEWFFSKLGTTTGVGTVRWKKYTIEQLLIPTINEDLKKLFSNWVDETNDGVKSTDELAEVANAEIYNILHLSKDEIAYVEGFYPPLKASPTDH